MNARLIPFKQVQGIPQEMSDDALLAACAAGDSAALAALFDRHHRGVQRFLARVYRLDPVDLEDILQVVFLEVFQKAGRFKAQSSVSSWIMGIALNKARHHIRSATRRRSLFEALTERWSGPSQSLRPDVEAEGRETLARFDVALRALPEHLRVVFVMCELEGVAGVDAARALDLREGTLYRRLHQARERLKAAIEEEGS